MKKILLFTLIFIFGFNAQNSFSSDIDDIVDFKKPISIVDIFMYSDGGTIGVIAVDDEGRDIKFCADGRMEMVPYPMPENWKPRRKHLFWGATHPESEGAVMLALDGKGQKKIVAAMRDWLKRNISKEKQDFLWNKKSVVGLNKVEAKAMRVLWFLGGPEKK